MPLDDLIGGVRLLGRRPRPYVRGTHYDVHCGFYDLQEVAIKTIRQSKRTSPTAAQQKVDRERVVWAALNHPNILPFMGFSEDDPFLPYGELVSPWCSYGDTDHFLAQYGYVLTVIQRIDLWKGAIAGVKYLHSHTPSLIHGCIKPNNVLVDKYGKAVLYNFSLVGIFDEGSDGVETTRKFLRAPRYLAPELVIGDGVEYPTCASDVYALGCIGLEFVFDQKVYAHRGYRHIIKDIKDGIPPSKRPKDITPETSKSWEIIQRCWNPDPNGRPSASQMLEGLAEPDVDAIIGSPIAQFDTNTTGKNSGTLDHLRKMEGLDQGPANGVKSTSFFNRLKAYVKKGWKKNEGKRETADGEQPQIRGDAALEEQDGSGSGSGSGSGELHFSESRSTFGSFSSSSSNGR